MVSRQIRGEGGMANNEGFIEEVTDELRRDRLFALMRRWAWLAALIVVGAVGGAAWFEYSRAQDRATAQAFGDALIAALDGADPQARVAALDMIEAPGPEGRILLALLAAGEVAQGGAGAPEAAARLRAAAEMGDVPRHYRDLALLRAEMLDPSDPDTARLVLGTLAEPGAPYAALAEEQLALLDLRAGDVDAALDRLRSLERSAAATPGLQQRASQLIVTIEAGAQLIDTTPETAPEPDPVQGAAPEGPVSAPAAEVDDDAEAATPAPAADN
jgi:hypothetical protein